LLQETAELPWYNLVAMLPVLTTNEIQELPNETSSLVLEAWEAGEGEEGW
jgi:hypothetical protein